MHNYTHKGYKPNQGKAKDPFLQSGQVVATVALDQDGTRFAKKRINSSKHALRTPPALKDIHPLSLRLQIGVSERAPGISGAKNEKTRRFEPTGAGRAFVQIRQSLLIIDVFQGE